MSETNQELVSSEVRNYLESVIKGLGLKTYTTEISPGTCRGDNFFGIIAKVQVRGADGNGKSATLNLIIKSAPRAGLFRAFAPVNNAYSREIYMYSRVFPAFVKMQEERGILRPFKSFAKYYGSTMRDLNEALIMEDMKERGFQLQDRHKALDYNHAVLILKEYGKFHAVSFALRDQKPELFRELSDNTEDIFFGVADREHMINGTRQQSDKALGALDPIKHKVAYDKFKDFQDKMVSLVIEVVKSKVAGQYAVVGHGDCWINNYLFKYNTNDSKENVPSEICFLDYQLSRLGSPALDLSYFILTCTDKELRDEHYDHLIQEYYNSLSSHLRELGSDPEKLFPFGVLQDHLKRFSLYGLYMAVIALFVMTSEVDELPDVNTVTDKQDALEKFEYQSKNVDKYNSRMSGLILDFVKLGYNFSL